MTTTAMNPEPTTLTKRRAFTTSRVTGLFYLGLAISGVIGFLLAGQQIYDAGDVGATMTRLVENQGLARLSLVGELGVVAFQVLAALWFFKLWRSVDSFAAGALAGFGLLGAAAVMVGLIFSTQALSLAIDPVAATTAQQSSMIQVMAGLRETAWQVGNLFFGLWLIPMGYLVLVDRMPRVLGWILVAGGIGYVLTAVISLGMAVPPAGIIEGLPYLATIGEFWIIGYLLWDPRSRALAA